MGIRLGAGPEDSPAVVLGETCLHLTEQNKSSGAWSKKEKKKEGPLVSREGEEEETRKDFCRISQKSVCGF